MLLRFWYSLVFIWMTYPSVAQSPTTLPIDSGLIVPVFPPLGEAPVQPLLIWMPTYRTGGLIPGFDPDSTQGWYLDDPKQLATIQQTWYGYEIPTNYPFRCVPASTYWWCQADTLATQLDVYEFCQFYSSGHKGKFLNLYQGKDSLAWKPAYLQHHLPTTRQEGLQLLTQLSNNPHVLYIEEQEWMRYEGRFSFTNKAIAYPLDNLSATLLQALNQQQLEAWLLEHIAFISVDNNNNFRHQEVTIFCSKDLAKKFNASFGSKWDIKEWYSYAHFDFISYWNQ